MADDYRPEGADQMVRERESRFDPKRRRMFHLDRLGAVVWEECPEGYRYDKDGVLQPKEPETAPAAEKKEG